MSEQLKPCPFCGSPKTEAQRDDGLFWIKCLGCYSTGPATTKYSGAEDNFYLDWNTRTEDTALAAKDARIAELDGLLEHVQEGSEILQSLIDNIEAKGNYSAESTINFLRQAHSCLLPVFAVQQHPDPTSAEIAPVAANPSEDGPEVVAIAEGEGVAWRGLRWAAGIQPMNVKANSELMTVAQCKRIVAAKDWEISTITAWWRAANVRALELEEKVSKKDAEIARLKADDAEAIKRPPYAHICIGMPAALHHDTRKLLERFTHALAVKLRAAEEKYGYSNGWKDADWMDECRAKLAEHMAKGDPRDVAAYCAFLWHHGESTAQPARQVDGDSHGPARQVGEYGDAYQGAREDLAIWKRRALEAEATLRQKEQIIDSLVLEAQGETRMGEPLISVARQVGGDEREQFIVWAIENFPNAYTGEAAEHYWDNGHVSALAWQARAALAPAAVDPWAPSGHEYDHSIHHNPDAKAWADLFVSTFPLLTDKHDLMLGWFANAMMAMHDWLKSKEMAPAAVVMPDRLTWEQGRKPHARANAEGWNAALDEVARLNRRAIPEGLLNRLVTPGNWGGDVGFWNAIHELRALLGNVE